MELKDSIGIEPYHDYCLHCDHYRESVATVGLEYIYDFADIDKAACSIFIYDPKVFDGRIIVDEDTIIMDRRAGDNEYFHRDFHSGMNNGVQYLGEKYGDDVVKDYLTIYTKNVYKKEIESIKNVGLKAIEDKILGTYKKEKAEDAVTTELSDNSLVVKVAYCPAVKHLKNTGRVISSWYRYTTEYVMSVLAEEAGASFEMRYYYEETGKTEYVFTK